MLHSACNPERHDPKYKTASHKNKMIFLFLVVVISSDVAYDDIKSNSTCLSYCKRIHDKKLFEVFFGVSSAHKIQSFNLIKTLFSE